MTLTRISALIAAAGALFTLTGCSSSDGGDPTENAPSNLMTYNGNSVNEAGEPTSLFTYYAENSDVPVPYASAAVPSLTTADVGKRVAVRYFVGSGSTITVLNTRLVPTATLAMADTQDAEANNQPVDVVSISRQGPYINLYAKLPAEGTHTYSVLCDRNTYGTSQPHIYISVTPSTESSGYSLSTLSCYDISSVWNSGATQSVVVHINNTAYAGAPTTFTFRK
ncbi:MAG: hypothetical protein J6C77_05250 [Muribaculaceae bacterium]|nr:hypothetical protein [Muribaculaceae bacterium]